MSAAETRTSILKAARELIVAAPPGAPTPSLGSIASRAGVSRLSVYHHFGSKAGLEMAIAAAAPAVVTAGEQAGTNPLDVLHRRIASTCERWAADPALFRRLPAAGRPSDHEADRQLALALAGSDLLRPGCSLREAEDVIGLVTSFEAFDRLHSDGRRSLHAVAEILFTVASSILSPQP